jgi:hypothetical protein
MHKNRNPKTLFHTNYEKSTKLIWNKKWRNWEDRERTREIWRKEGRIKRRGLMRCWSESIQAIMIMLELNWTCLKYRWIVLFRWRFSPSAFSDLLLRVRRKRCHVEETREWRVRGKSVIW